MVNNLLQCRSGSENESHSVVSDSLQPHGLYRPWNSPGQNTGMGSLSLLQGIFPTQGWNPGLPHCRQILYQLSHMGSPCRKQYRRPGFNYLPNAAERTHHQGQETHSPQARQLPCGKSWRSIKTISWSNSLTKNITFVREVTRHLSSFVTSVVFDLDLWKNPLNFDRNLTKLLGSGVVWRLGVWALELNRMGLESWL